MKASATQVRAHYHRQGYDVRINMSGKVEFRKPDGPWLDGRWVREYHVIDGQVVLQ